MTIENTREQLEQMTAADIMEHFAAAGIEGEQDWDAETTTYQHGGLAVAVSGTEVRVCAVDDKRALDLLADYSLDTLDHGETTMKTNTKIRRFACYLSDAHLNSQNVAVYTRDNADVLVRLEDVTTGRVLGKNSRNFDSLTEAFNWYNSLPGRGLGRLANAIDAF